LIEGQWDFYGIVYIRKNCQISVGECFWSEK
jgi:hypothetical protein